jgi:hypothetical protein
MKLIEKRKSYCIIILNEAKFVNIEIIKIYEYLNNQKLSIINNRIKSYFF